MYKSKILLGLIVLAYVLFVVFQFSGNEFVASSFSSSIFPLIALFYCTTVKKKTLFFCLFLLSYSLSELMFFTVGHIPYMYVYFIANILSMLSYVFLLLEVCKSVCAVNIIKNFKVHVVVLVGLSVYIAYVLQQAINPYIEMTLEYLVEVTYSITMLLLLSMSLLNFLTKDDRKSLLFFFGALCIVFSEVINVAYLYVAHQNLFNFISVSLFVLAFYFLYQQSRAVSNGALDAVELQ